MKNKKILGLVLMFGLVLPISYVTAADYFPKSENGLNNVVLNDDQVAKDDLYVVGRTVSVNKKVLGDLLSFGSIVNVLGGVDEDLLAVGGNVMVEGPVLGDARVLGGNITINNSDIGGDLLLAGGTILINKSVSTTGDLWIAGQVVNTAGIITGNTKIVGGEIFLNGIISGNLEVKSNSKVTFGPDAKVVGKITYTGNTDPIIQDGAQIGEVTRVSVAKDESKASTASAFIMSLIFRLLTLFVTVLVMVKLFGNKIQIILAKHDFSFSAKFWQTVGIGLMVIVLVPIVSVILLATVVGMYLGIILFIWYVFAILISIILSVIILGGTIVKLQKSKMEKMMSFNLELSWKTVLVGVLGLGILCVVPIVGWIGFMILFLSAFGTIVVAIKDRTFH